MHGMVIDERCSNTLSCGYLTSVHRWPCLPDPMGEARSASVQQCSRVRYFTVYSPEYFMVCGGCVRWETTEVKKFEVE